MSRAVSVIITQRKHPFLRRNKMKRVLAFSIAAIMVCFTFPVLAQDAHLDAAKRNAVIEAVLKNLNEAYVFPEAAKKMEQAVRERMAKKEYDALTSPTALAT